MNQIEKTDFGTMNDQLPVKLFILRGSSGFVAKITNYGAILTALEVPDRKGQLVNVVHGFDNLKQYLAGHPFFGAIAGRVANRIARGRFDLDGKTYTLAVNNGANHLHGGLKGFDKALWQAAVVSEKNGASALELQYESQDGEEGYPGKVKVTVRYSLGNESELRIDYRAVTDQPTPLNLTNHSYFNLSGTGNILDHELRIEADFYTPIDSTFIPTGEIRAVKETALDFTQLAKVGTRIDQLKPTPGGYDHNFVLRHPLNVLSTAAWLRDPKSGRTLEVQTTEPGVQLYTGNFLDGKYSGSGGIRYGQHSGLCLETQHFPDAVHHSHFPSVIIGPDETYRSTTVFKFGNESA